MHFHNHFLKKLIFIDAQILSSEEGDVGLAVGLWLWLWLLASLTWPLFYFLLIID
jgi:hypothetical protein